MEIEKPSEKQHKWALARMDQALKRLLQTPPDPRKAKDKPKAKKPAK